MEPLKPLGQALSDRPFSSPELARPEPVPAGQQAPFSVFDWFTLLRAGWKWLIRPIFRLVVYILGPRTEAEEELRRQEQMQRHAREQAEESTKRWLRDISGH